MISLITLVKSWWCSLVRSVEDLLFSPETAISHLQNGLVERLRLIKVISVASPDLVSVLVLLCLPGSAVPELTI